MLKLSASLFLVFLDPSSVLRETAALPFLAQPSSMNTLFSFGTTFQLTKGPSRKSSVVGDCETASGDSDAFLEDEGIEQTTPQEDAALYNMVASAAVDLSDAYVHNGILAGEFSFFLAYK